MPSDKPGRVIFVGNIPYGLTEEQIVTLFSTAGNVTSFRLVYDKDTGRPKGFGFAEFADADSAASAVRNLNGHDIMGRTLRVDYSNDGGGGDSGPSPQSGQGHQQSQQLPQHPAQPNGSEAIQSQSQVLPTLPPGADLPPGISCPDAISRTLNALPAPQLLDLISQMKGLVTNDPQRATALLTQAPQLSYAIFQALLLLGLVDTTVLGQVVQEHNQQQQAQSLPPQLPQPYQPPPMQPQYPNHYQQPNVPTPPIQNQGYLPPQAPQRPPHLTEAQWESIRQLCNIPQHQIDAMPNPQERNEIMKLKQQYMPYFTNQAYMGVQGF